MADQESQQHQAENNFAKACTYLNFNKSARWLAHAAAVGTAVMTVLLLCVLWLFVDLMVWRGRVPDSQELTELQRRRFVRSWEDMKTKPGEREAWLEKAGFRTASERKALASRDFPASSGGPAEPGELTPEQVDALWLHYAREVLANSVGDDAAQRVFGDGALPVLSRGNHGILSLVVREEASGQFLSPAALLARWNTWMWNDPPGSSAVVPLYLTGLSLVALVFGLLWVVFAILNREMAARATIEATTRLRRAVYHHTFRLGTLAIRAMGPSEAVSILTRHIEALHDALYNRLTVTFREPVTFCLLLLFAFAIDWRLALSITLFAILIWIVGTRLVGYFRKQSKLATNVAAERLTIIRESLMLMRLVKTYMMEQFNQARIERQLARYSHAQRVRHRGDSLISPTLMLLGGLGTLVLLYVAGLLVLYGQLSVAGAVVLTASLLCLYVPLERYREGRKVWRRGQQAADQVFGFLDARGGVGQIVGAEFLPPVAKQIEFDKVSLRDPSTGRVLLDDMSITFPAGQRIGLVSADELEKHALVYLIPRLLDPSAGEIRIDQYNLRLVTLDSLRAQIGMVMMHNLVFHDTVRNNIGCGDQSYTLPQIIEAAKVAHAHHFIQKLPQGYETPIGELGQSLSLSQQFRIALARAILRDPALMIIEEPDADLDEETKDLLDDTMARFLPGRTAIFLPHRISTLRSCDRLYLLHKGRIVAQGTHKELLAGNKLYRHLHYLEFNEMDEQV